MEYYLAVKNKKSLPFVTAWMDIENIMLSEISQSQSRTASKDVEKGEPIYTIGGNAYWCSHCGKQYGDSSKN